LDDFERQNKGLLFYGLFWRFQAATQVIHKVAPRNYCMQSR